MLLKISGITAPAALLIFLFSACSHGYELPLVLYTTEPELQSAISTIIASVNEEFGCEALYPVVQPGAGAGRRTVKVIFDVVTEGAIAEYRFSEDTIAMTRTLLHNEKQLLVAMLHELGHAAGFAHTPREEDGLMSPILSIRMVRLPLTEGALPAFRELFGSKPPCLEMTTMHGKITQ